MINMKENHLDNFVSFVPLKNSLNKLFAFSDIPFASLIVIIRTSSANAIHNINTIKASINEVNLLSELLLNL